MAEHSKPFRLNDGGTVHFALDTDGHVVSLALDGIDGEHARVELTPSEARDLGERLAAAAEMV